MRSCEYAGVDWAWVGALQMVVIVYELPGALVAKSSDS